MAHCIEHDPDDPWLAWLRDVVRPLAQVREEVSHGRPQFRVGRADRVFCVFGTEERLDHGRRRPRPSAIAVKIDPAELPALDDDPRFFAPRFWFAHGWRGIDPAAEASAPDAAPGLAAEIAELVDASHRLVGPRLIGRGARRG